MKPFHIKQSQITTRIQDKFGQDLTPTLLTSEQFNKIFHKKTQIGQGAYGSIKLVENIYGQKLAIKQFKVTQSQYGVSRQVSIMKKFNHPNILRFIGLFKIQGAKQPFILTEYCKYKSLKSFSSYLCEMTQAEKIKMAFNIFKGLQEMHSQNIMHRDLKPENILVDQHKNPKICDFGFCRYDQAEQLQKSRKVGTPLYNSPQTDLGNYTKKCDIFSYGLIVYYIFSNGKHFFTQFSSKQDLRASRKHGFKNMQQTLEKINVCQQIIQLLSKTIIQKQQHRYSTLQVQQFWIKLLQRRSDVRQLISKDKQKNDKQTNAQAQVYDKEAKYLGQIIRRQDQDELLFQDTQKLKKIYNKVNQINQCLKLFKQQIQCCQLSKSQKHIISFGCFMLLQLHLERLFVGSMAISSEGQGIMRSVGNLVSQIFMLKQLVGKNLVKIVAYIQIIKHLIKPNDLFTAPTIFNSMDQVKKLQSCLSQLSNEDSRGKFKKSNQMIKDKDLYALIIQKYHLKVQITNFIKDFCQMRQKFIRNQPQDNKQVKRGQIMAVFNKIKDIKLHKD